MQAARHALTLANIALDAQVKGQGQGLGGFQGQAEFADAGIALERRRCYIIAVGRCPGASVKLSLIGSSDVGSHVVVYSIGKASAEAQAVGIHVLERDFFARGEAHAIALLARPEILAVHVEAGGFRDVPEVAEAA